ncbi:MAG: hypothetical protein IJG87_08400 [Ruminococcus sp.]|nr:hypothetical protein [Ruminococcus sp.]
MVSHSLPLMTPMSARAIFTQPSLQTAHGGAFPGGAHLTVFGEAVVKTQLHDRRSYIN